MAKQLNIAALSCAIVTAAWLCPAGAQAHHSFAMFDTAKPGTITATVEKFEWSNPHCWLDVLSKGPGGVQEKWSFEGQSPSMLTRKGWSKATIKPGDTIKVSYFPNRDGTKSGALRSITLADGTPLGSYGAAE